MTGKDEFRLELHKTVERHKTIRLAVVVIVAAVLLSVLIVCVTIIIASQSFWQTVATAALTFLIPQGVGIAYILRMMRSRKRRLEKLEDQLKQKQSS